MKSFKVSLVVLCVFIFSGCSWVIVNNIVEYPENNYDITLYGNSYSSINDFDKKANNVIQEILEEKKLEYFYLIAENNVGYKAQLYSVHLCQDSTEKERLIKNEKLGIIYEIPKPILEPKKVNDNPNDQKISRITNTPLETDNEIENINKTFKKDILLVLNAGYGGTSDDYRNSFYNNTDLSFLTGNIELGCELRLTNKLYVTPKLGVRFTEISGNDYTPDGTTMYLLGVDAKYYIYKTDRIFELPSKILAKVAWFANLGINSVIGSSGPIFETGGPILDATIGCMYITQP